MTRSEIQLMAGIIVGFPILFIGIWSGVCYLLATVGGWQKLATKYETEKTTVIEQKFTDENGRFGFTNYKFTLTVGFSPAGLYIANNPFFRIGHPPLLIPWTNVKIVPDNGFFMHLRIDDTNVRISKKFLPNIQQYTR